MCFCSCVSQGRMLASCCNKHPKFPATEPSSHLFLTHPEASIAVPGQWWPPPDSVVSRLLHLWPCHLAGPFHPVRGRGKWKFWRCTHHLHWLELNRTTPSTNQGGWKIWSRQCKSPETGTQGCLRASHRGGGRGKDWGQGWRAHSKACAFTLRWETLEGFEQGGMLSLPLLKILC